MHSELDQVLVIFTKVPLPGAVKTRLASVLSAEQAARLQSCFLVDEIRLAMTLPDVEVVVAFTPAHAEAQLRAILPEPVRLLPQREGDLGKRMAQTFSHLFEAGRDLVVLIGSDLPTLPSSILAQAFAALAQADIVLGPSTDGGYYLIGMRRLHATLFDGVAWGTSLVLAQTAERIRTLGLRSASLPVWYDVDTPDDLSFLAAHLAVLEQDPKAVLPTVTFQTLEELALTGRK